ncbi:type III secretion system apparatus protein YscQ/HrcQ [Noviherbaspirillum humi]|uniref:Type III secretion system apparatus protein YscQ/HrcQ n=1 Tax=Noviherbaspirillum humi TaxID=1688639 RepID=A0A239JXZ4_9BURK|nr:FliM/FliN family flagellar motor switch protein [Noviherbaspirillum humi]SNT10529.1 type III secretion system apparatus protein YscQ/HrcQ [Noviherbaspirillum humi]
MTLALPTISADWAALANSLYGRAGFQLADDSVVCWRSSERTWAPAMSAVIGTHGCAGELDLDSTAPLGPELCGPLAHIPAGDLALVAEALCAALLDHLEQLVGSALEVKSVKLNTAAEPPSDSQAASHALEFEWKRPGAIRGIRGRLRGKPEFWKFARAPERAAMPAAPASAMKALKLGFAVRLGCTELSRDDAARIDTGCWIRIASGGTPAVLRLNLAGLTMRLGFGALYDLEKGVAMIDDADGTSDDFLTEEGMNEEDVHADPGFAMNAGPMASFADSFGGGADGASRKDAMAQRLQSAPLRISFDLGSVTFTLEQLCQLQAGYVFNLGRLLAERPVSLKIDGKEIGRGSLLAIGDAIGVCVEVLHHQEDRR